MENKEQSLTYHYRQVPIEMQNNYQDMAIRIITSFGYTANKAHFAVEAKPPVKWNKGIIILIIKLVIDIIVNINLIDLQIY